jgi:type II secretory pathway predicted ATPase ExeA
MISVHVRKHFKLVGNPFLNEIRDADDIFLSRDHRFIKSMIVEAASAAGLCAVYGEVGSGKSTMRKAAYRDLTAAGIKVIYPLILDKAKIHAGSLMDAVIMDLSEETPKRTHEAKTRQAYELLRVRKESGLDQVLIIEEAHLLTVHAMKYVKQIYEFESGYSRLCGVVLIGQSELGVKMDETQYPQLRELIRRTAAAEIQGLDTQDVGRYLLHKIARSNGRAAPPEVFADDAFKAIANRLTKTSRGGRIISTAFPLSINNLAARAMAQAAEFGEPKVTAEIVNSL